MKLLIKEIRISKGMGLRELARKSKISQGYLSELENEFNGKDNPTLEIICKLAKALEVKPEELFKC